MTSNLPKFVYNVHKLQILHQYLSKMRPMVYSHSLQPRSGQEPGTNGLYETVRKLSHYTRTSEFSLNTQSWQCWHFCTTSNVNKLKTATSWIKIFANSCLSQCIDVKLMYLVTLSNLFAKFTQYKNANFVCWKLEGLIPIVPHCSGPSSCLGPSSVQCEYTFTKWKTSRRKILFL